MAATTSWRRLTAARRRRQQRVDAVTLNNRSVPRADRRRAGLGRHIHLADELGQHRSQGPEDLGQVRGLGGVPLQVLGLGERELQLFGESFRKVISANRNTTLPNAVAIGDDQVCRISAERDDNR